MKTLLDTDRGIEIVCQLLFERFWDTFDFNPIIIEREREEFLCESPAEVSIFCTDRRFRTKPAHTVVRHQC